MREKCIFLLTTCLFFVCSVILPAYATDFKELFEQMDLDELQQVSEMLNGIINERKIGNAVLIVEPAETTLAAGKKAKLAVSSDAREITEKTQISYESSDESIAIIKNGEVVGVAEGSAIIRVVALFEDGAKLESSSKVNVVVPVTAINAPKQATAFVGGELNLNELITVVPENATVKGLKYTVDDDSILSIDENGLAKGIKGGVVTVVAESEQNEPAVKASQIKISVNEAVSELRISSKSSVVGKGAELKLEANVLPISATNKDVEWSSADPNIAVVSGAGVVKGKGTGKTTITCTAKDGSGVSAKTEITVITAVSSVRFAKKDISLINGQNTTLRCEVLPKDATDKSVSWSSSNKSIASIDNSGKITANAVGSCVITAKANDGSGKESKITVYVEPTNPIYVNSIHWQTTWGQKNGKMGVTGISNCIHRKVRAFTCRVECTTWYGNETSDTITYSGRAIGPGQEGKSKLSSYSISGFSTASKVKITVISVTFEDGTVYSIPSSDQVSTYFDM